MSDSGRGHQAVFEAVGPAAGTAGLVIDSYQPVRSRWTWQPLLPELWMREQEGRLFREMIEEKKKEV